MNILLLAPQPFYQDRGTPIAVKLLAQALARQGHIVHLLVFSEGEDISLPGVTLHRHIRLPGLSGIKPGLSPKKILCDFFLFLKAVNLVRRYDFDLIHAVEEAVFMALVLQKVFKTPYVYDMDSCMSAQIVDRFPALGFARRAMEWPEKAAITRSSGVLPVCKSLEDMVRNHAPETLTTRLEDITLLEKNDDGIEDLRRELAIEGVLLMYVGNLEKYQGVDLILAGMQEALKQREDLTLVLIGGSEDDLALYRARIKELDLDAKVFFCGPRPVTMLGFYLGQADILVSPRIQGNNTPMKLYSYLDSGKPVLATDLPTHTQVLDERISCLVQPVPAAMARGILLLAGDETLRQKIGIQARQRVADEYSLPAFERKLKSFYQTLQARLGI
ncbi:MAG: glycosyltransferase family 4 protein [Desulfobulbaceae bacterium]|nr:glycosyltransferase family 4 protein [Desulfobulbaceae bacterium]